MHELPPMLQPAVVLWFLSGVAETWLRVCPWQQANNKCWEQKGKGSLTSSPAVMPIVVACPFSAVISFPKWGQFRSARQ